MMPQTAMVAKTKATPIERFLGMFIDALMLVPVYLVLMFIPFVGWAAAALIAAAWWVLRDAKGISVGKKVMGLEVIAKSGLPATEEQLMKRNYTIAGGAAAGVIPFAGPLIGAVVNLVEGILLLTKGERYGDEMAGTMVVKKVG
jgi:uncharacterized RDD family membrane protein YckC